MGFHVDVAELIKLRDAYLESAEKVEGELDTAKNGMNGIITSNSCMEKSARRLTMRLITVIIRLL